MKLATSTGHYGIFTDSVKKIVNSFKGTGFKNLDVSFYDGKQSCLLNRADWREQIKLMKDEGDKNSFSFVQAHSPGTNECIKDMDYCIRLTKRSIEACGMLGIKNIAVHSYCIVEQPFVKPLKKNLQLNRIFFEQLYDSAEKYNVNLCIENWPHPHAPKPNPEAYPASACDLLEMIDFLANDRLYACWDTGHAHMNFYNQYDEILKLGSKLKAVHIQDNFGNMDLHLMPYMGTIDFQVIVKALLDIDYRGTFTFETSRLFQLEHSGPIELVRQSVKLLYGVGKWILKKSGAYEE